MKTVRLGIVGVGVMGSHHSRNIGKLRNVTLAAICDIDKAKADKIGKELSCRVFYDSSAMIDSGLIDAILIATPHYFHTTIGIEALQKGLHVLVEKPISAHKADCERLIAAHKNKKQVFCAMFMQRTDPHYQRIKQAIDNGELGKLIRINWIITNWFRSETYYASGGWRATWKGEGGGVLLNQCPHNLDLITWMCGMPKRVTGYCSIGKWHNIEVEDEVTSYWEYPNGATGVFITCTGEAPGTNRLEICGERGKIVLENDVIKFTRNEIEMSKFCKTTKEMFSAPQTWDITIPAYGNGGQHNEIIQNFVDAILEGKQLIAPAEQGIRSVELANAMLYSSMTGKPVDLPLDGKVYEKMLQKLIRESRFQKKGGKGGAVDLSKSFNK